jgi:hypothetical protein
MENAKITKDEAEECLAIRKKARLHINLVARSWRVSLPTCKRGNAAKAGMTPSLFGGNVDLDQGDTDRITIRSALNLFFGTTLAPFQAHPLTKLGPRNPGQVTVAERERSYHSICT